MRAAKLAIVLIVPTVAWAEPISISEIKVRDGDTIQARGERYRLVGFDTPETWSRRRVVSPEERALGKQARTKLKALLQTGSLDLTDVPCARTKHARPDAQGRWRTNNRLCARLTLDGRDIGDILIEEGLARKFVCTETKCPKQSPWMAR